MAEYPLIENTKFEEDDEYIPVPGGQSRGRRRGWMAGLRIGIHTSISGSYLNALESAKKLGANALQIFSSSPRMWQTANVRIPASDVKAFRGAAGGAGTWAAGNPRELSDQSGSAARCLADAVDPGVS